MTCSLSEISRYAARAEEDHASARAVTLNDEIEQLADGAFIHELNDSVI